MVAEDPEKVGPETHSSDVQSNATTATGSGASNKQRAKHQKRREAQQGFQNPWMVGALKGHAGLILDMNFSANGKYLASCAEGMY